jgi:hypothetical protein
VTPRGDRRVDAQVRVFVQTRGSARALDYAFLGGAPPQPWWRAYREATAFDHPTVLVRSDGERWAAYLSGVPSARVDAVGTVVRYTLVLDGPCGVADAGCVTAGVAAWLDDVADGVAGRPGDRLAGALDARFPADDVQRWLVPGDGGPTRGTGSDVPPVRRKAGPAGVAVVAEVRRRALAALGSLPPPAPAADERGEWIGSVGSSTTRAAFVARVAALVGGAPGRALLLNLVGGPDDVTPLRDPTSPVAVLVETADPDLARPTALRPVVEAKKAPTPPAAARSLAPLPVAAALVLVAALMVAVLLLTL